MSRLKVIIIVCVFLFLGSSQNIYADVIQVNVDATQYSYDTGSGVDGDVVLRLKPGEPNTAQLVVNGVVKSITNQSQTINSNVFESYNEEISIKTFYIEDIVCYLPVHTTYQPSQRRFVEPNDGVIPLMGAVPEFNTLLIEEGVMLASRQAMAFKVKEELKVNGYITTMHGAGGAGHNYAAGGNGGNAYGDIFLIAGEINLAERGETAAYGAIYAGWGGGGGGSLGDVGGVGGYGGNILIFCNVMSNQGEIRAGNGGGGGGGAYPFDSKPGAPGGDGGYLYLIAKQISSLSSTVFASGYGGGGGGALGSGSPGDSDCKYYRGGGGGYGAGGGGCYDYCNAGNGGSAGNPGGNAANIYEGKGGTAGKNGLAGAGGGVQYCYDWYGIGHTGGGSGGAGGSNPAYGYHATIPGGIGGLNGSLIIRAESIMGSPLIIVGYTVGGSGSARGQEPVDIKCESSLFAQITSQISNSTNRSIKAVGNTYIKNGVYTDIDVIGDVTLENTQAMNTDISGNVEILGLQGQYVNLYLDGDVTISSGNIEIGNGVITGKLISGRNVSLSGNITVCFADISSSLNNLCISSQSDVRFFGNPDYLLSSYWENRSILVNEVQIKGCYIIASTNDTGINYVDLTTYVKYNNPEGIMPELQFVVEASQDNESWKRMQAFTRNLTGSVSWNDPTTAYMVKTYYRVGFRKNNLAKGYVFFLDNIGNTTSEGGGLDETIPHILFFKLAGNQKTVTTDTINIEVLVTDNRTSQENFQCRVLVNDTPYYWNGSSFSTGNTWGTYEESLHNLPLHDGYNEIIFQVKDEAGNIAMTVSEIEYAAPSIVPALTGDLLQPKQNSSYNAVNVEAVEYEVDKLWVVRSNYVTIDFEAVNLPLNAKYYAYSLDGIAFSQLFPVDNGLSLSLDGAAGFKTIFFVFANADKIKNPKIIKMNIIIDCQEPQVSILNQHIKVTRNEYAEIQLAITDDFSTSYEWKINNGNWTMVPENKRISISLQLGLNHIPIYIRDQAGNISEVWYKIWRI